MHPIAGGLATALIATFLAATLIVELAGDTAQIAAVKRAILYGIALLVPLLAAAGASGFRLSRGHRKGVLDAKARRMPLIAGNGLLVLLPCAVVLDKLAAAGDFGRMFMIVQGVEVVAGSINLTLLFLMLRDGLTLRRGRRRTSA